MTQPASTHGSPPSGCVCSMESQSTKKGARSSPGRRAPGGQEGPPGAPSSREAGEGPSRAADGPQEGTRESAGAVRQEGRDAGSVSKMRLAGRVTSTSREEGRATTSATTDPRGTRMDRHSQDASATDRAQARPRRTAEGREEATGPPDDSIQAAGAVGTTRNQLDLHGHPLKQPKRHRHDARRCEQHGT